MTRHMCSRCNENASFPGSFCGPCDAAIGREREEAIRSVTRMLDGGLLTARQVASLIDTLSGRTNALTADRKPIIMGGRYLDYDLRPTVVTGISTVSLDARERDGAAIWWRTTTGMFDGTRLALRMPR